MPDNARPHPAPNSNDDGGSNIIGTQQAHRAANTWLRYTGMGFQMLGCILLGVGLGWLWDRNRHDTGKPWGLIIGSIGGCALAIGLAVRIVLRGK